MGFLNVDRNYDLWFLEAFDQELADTTCVGRWMPLLGPMGGRRGADSLYSWTECKRSDRGKQCGMAETGYRGRYVEEALGVTGLEGVSGS